MKNHTHPAFYLTPWGSPNVCEMKLVRGHIAVRYPHPNATGYVVNLYTTEGAENPHALETEFMSPLDNDAAVALTMMLNGEEPTEPRYRQAWATFICSLLFRHRECVEMVKDQMKELWSKGTAALEEMWAANRSPDSPQTFAEATTMLLGNRAGVDAANMLAEIIANDRAVPDIMNMHWVVVDLSGSRRTLMTSDRPIIMPLGLANRDAHIALPVSPRKLFVAAYNNRFQLQLPAADKNAIVKTINKDVVRQARQYVWDVDDAQKIFVEKHIGQQPDRVILTEQQRQQSLDLVRGAGETPSP